MMTLEEIMQVYCGCKHPFKKNGELSKEGWKAYEHICRFIYDVCGMCEKDREAESIVRVIDEIINEEY